VSDQLQTKTTKKEIETMKTLEQNTKEIKTAGMYSYETIEDFGWGSHIDVSRGGLVINMSDGKTVIANQNRDMSKFELAYEYDLTDEQTDDIDDLLALIADGNI
jgi:hypothetical protein